MHDKVSTFHIAAHNHIYAYMALGTVNHCLFTWTYGIPIHADEARSIGAFYARRQERVKTGWSKGLCERIIARRQEWLKRENDNV